MFKRTHNKINSKQNKRPFSNIDKNIQYPSNQTFTKSISKDFNLNTNIDVKVPKKYYLDISQIRKESLLQKKLFYNKIYNRNYENKDKLGLSAFLSIQKEKKSTKTRDNSRSRLSSTATYRKINLRTKSLQKTQSDKESYYLSYDKDKFSDKNKLLKEKNNKIDKICEINDEEFKKIYNNNSISKKRPISVSMLLNKEKNIEKKIELKPEDINSEKINSKNIFIIKFGYFLEMFQKVISGIDWVRPDFKTTYSNITTNLSKGFETFNKILIEKTSDEKCLQSLCHFCHEILSWQKLAIDEIRHLKRENIILNRRQNNLELEQKKMKEEIKEINNDIIKYDLIKVKKGRSDESKVEKIKKEYIDMESNYVVTIYQLKNEIGQLTELLGKYKGEKNYTDELRNKIKRLKEELAENKTIIFKNNFQQKNKDKLIDIYIEELTEKINNFDNEKNIWKEKENKLSEEMINIKIKLERMNEVIKEKDNTILELQKIINQYETKAYLENLAKVPANTSFINEKKLKQNFSV